MLKRKHGDTRVLKLLLGNCLDISNPHSSIGRHLIRFTMTLLGGVPYWSVPSPSLLSIIPAPPSPRFSEKRYNTVLKLLADHGAPFYDPRTNPAIMKSNLGSFARWCPLKQAIRDRNPGAIMMLLLKGPLLYNPQFYPEALHEPIVQFDSEEDMWILNILVDYKADINGPAYYSYESREREEWDRNYAHFRKLILYPVDLAYPKITTPLY
jgi:hypothetical protein